MNTFKVEEHNGIINLYPVDKVDWMIMKTHDTIVPWKLYEKIDGDYKYIDEFMCLDDAYVSAKST